MGAWKVWGYGRTKEEAEAALEEELDKSALAYYQMFGHHAYSIQFKVVGEIRPPDLIDEVQKQYDKGMRWVGVARIHA